MGNAGSLWPYLLLGVAASVLLAGGLVMMKSRGEALPAASGAGMLRAIARWFRDPMWLAGIGVETAGYALYVMALTGAPVSLLAVMMQGGIALFVVFAAIFLGERADAREWTGIGGIVAAMILLAWSMESGAAQGGVEPAALMIVTGMAAAAGAAPAIYSRLRASGAAAAIASGVAFGLGSLYTKALADAFAAHGSAAIAGIVGNPWLYLTIAANFAGLVMLQNAFHQARGIIAMPLSSACSNLVPIVGGMAAFGEQLPAEPIAAGMRVGAFVLTIGAGALLAVGRE
ncbi:MAG TPA: hypothetical protein VEF07_09270 [Candidatus Binataceae bacterium]|nr:hypothetical protein [Candidatus Binataceae bacterium]